LKNETNLCQDVDTRATVNWSKLMIYSSTSGVVKLNVT